MFKIKLNTKINSNNIVLNEIYNHNKSVGGGVNEMLQNHWLTRARAYVYVCMYTSMYWYTHVYVNSCVPPHTAPASICCISKDIRLLICAFGNYLCTSNGFALKSLQRL